jgi:hypothetical protein
MLMMPLNQVAVVLRWKIVMQMKVDYRCLSSIEEEPRMKRKVVIKCANHQLVLWSSGGFSRCHCG